MITVSVIIPVYNDHRITRALDSVLSQVIPDNVKAQIIVVDDSDDGTSDLLLRYRKQIFHTSTIGGAKGVYAARNRGLIFAHGDIINFLGADDVYADEYVLSDIIRNYQNNPLLDLIHGWVAMVNAEGKIVDTPPRKNTKDLILSAHMFPDTASFWSKNVFYKYGLYRSDFKIAGDYEFFIRTVVKRKVAYAKLDRTLVLMETGGISWTQTFDLDMFIVKERLKAWRANMSWQMFVSEACFAKMVMMGNLRRFASRLKHSLLKKRRIS